MVEQRGEFGQDAGQLRAGEVGLPVAAAARVGVDSPVADHRPPAIRTVNFILDIPAWKPTKQNTAMLHKFVRYRLGFYLALKFAVLLFKIGHTFLKAYRLISDAIKFLAQEDDTLFVDRGNAARGKQVVDKSQELQRVHP